ncbi:hypothetical protein DUNSADRAFT_5354 [Dunaliella salina]|uniref:Uncharacterized protein n=1 Tax=Dunaliella salina TaxID=3046 RepID=A0ABQ7FUC3_DUNSA|nr:hypothetical protein DUNSADRAFT_5354 [Dunaliella salina]|eukprot:KAF5826018.1 hypothetical protein DUNSADRAFT_5354 [Dunaliella salina]
MSPAAFMVCSRTGASSSDISGGFWGLEEPSTATNLAAACAGSVAARGLMFANTHPAPRRWTPLQAPAQTRAERARHDNAERVQGTSACLALWHGTLAAGGCSAAVSAQVMPWLRTLACFPDYSMLLRVMPSSWCVFTMASSQNTVMSAPQPSSWGSSNASSGLLGQLQQMEWMQEQQAGLPFGSGEAEDIDALEEDPIDS